MTYVGGVVQARLCTTIPKFFLLACSWGKKKLDLRILEVILEISVFMSSSSRHRMFLGVVLILIRPIVFTHPCIVPISIVTFAFVFHWLVSSRVYPSVVLPTPSTYTPPQATPSPLPSPSATLPSSSPTSQSSSSSLSLLHHHPHDHHPFHPPARHAEKKRTVVGMGYVVMKGSSLCHPRFRLPVAIAPLTTIRTTLRHRHPFHDHQPSRDDQSH